MLWALGSQQRKRRTRPQGAGVPVGERAGEAPGRTGAAGVRAVKRRRRRQGRGGPAVFRGGLWNRGAGFVRCLSISTPVPPHPPRAARWLSCRRKRRVPVTGEGPAGRGSSPASGRARDSTDRRASNWPSPAAMGRAPAFDRGRTLSRDVCDKHVAPTFSGCFVSFRDHQVRPFGRLREV